MKLCDNLVCTDVSVNCWQVDVKQTALLDRWIDLSCGICSYYKCIKLLVYDRKLLVYDR